MNILVVDDHSVNRKLLRAQLEAEGQSVLEAADGVEALQTLDREPVDAVISDILMPNMDGFRFCLEVRKQPKFNAVTFIFYTSTYDSPTDRQLAQTVGGDRYIAKPAPVATILETLREVAQQGTSRRRARQEGGDNTSYVLKQYNEALVAKLEQRNIELTDRNRALQQAQQQLRLQATALETAANAILITDRTGTIQWVNPAFSTLTGYTAPEVAGKTPRVLKSGKHDQAFYRELWKTIQSGQTWRGEFINRRKDGTLFHDEHTITPVRSEHGEITHFIGILHDVTARKQAEEELRLTHEKLRHLLAHSPAVIYTLKLDGQKITPTVVSDSIGRLLGVTAAEAMSYEWWLGQLHPKDRDRAVASVSETLARGASRTEYRLRRKNDDYCWVEDSRRLLSDASGQPKEIVGVWVEITERKLAEDALRESERRFNEMMQRVELISLMLDREARITYCNDYLLRITGWRREEVLGRNWFELFIPPDNPGLRDVFAGLLADQPGAWHHENEILTCPGERRLIKWNNTVLRSISGEAIGTASLGEDVTDLRKAEEAFKRRAAELERFHRLSVGRELQMIELKKEINELARQAGKPAPYDLSFLESRPESSPRP